MMEDTTIHKQVHSFMTRQNHKLSFIYSVYKSYLREKEMHLIVLNVHL